MPKLCSVCGVTYSDTLVFCPADGTTLRSADLREDLVGSVIADRYLVTDILGEGGMGTVYLARHVRLPQQAAIKVLRKEMLQDPAAVARFNREAANASKIDHDRVARVYDFGETGEGVVYLAMEFVPGKTLKALLAAGGPMVPMRAANIVRQIAEGLDAAHRMEIVHRDLKPDNVMVIQDADGEERVKVVDFGIAKAFGDAGSAGGGGTVLTRTGFVVGTPEFMSPEQLLGGSLDARSDIYALAIVAYHCLTAELPFATNTPDHGMVARLVTPPRPLMAVQPTIRWPQPVQAVLDQALARDPAERPTSAGAFARTFAAAIEAWQVDGTQVTRATGLDQAPAAAAVGGSAGAATRAGAATSVGAYQPPATTARPAESGAGVSPAPSRRWPILAGVLGVALVVGGGAGWALMRSKNGPVKADSTAIVTPPPPVRDSSPVARRDSVTPPAVATKDSATRPNVVVPPPRVAAKDPTPAAPPKSPSRPAASTATANQAREAIDSIAKTYDLSAGVDETQAKAAARRAVQLIPVLMTSLANDDDNTWANLKLTDAYVLLEQDREACSALREAKRLARSPQQKRAVSSREGFCGGGE